VLVVDAKAKLATRPSLPLAECGCIAGAGSIRARMPGSPRTLLQVAKLLLRLMYPCLERLHGVIPPCDHLVKQVLHCLLLARSPAGTAVAAVTPEAALAGVAAAAAATNKPLDA
jgi:hypothetical protein